MTEPAPVQKKKRRFPTGLRILTGVFILILLCVLAVYIMFNFFGTRIMREFVQRKVHSSSQGLYSVDFTDLKINIFTRRITVKGFRLIPDTSLYNRLKAEGKAKKNLYQVTYKELTLYRLNLPALYRNKTLILRQMSIIRPEIILMGFSDTLARKKGRFKNVYEDIYPLASAILKEIRVDSILVEHARIINEKEGKPGKQNLGEYDFSAILRDVSINRFSFYNSQRVFYSRDIDFRIFKVKYSLTDSLYFLFAEEIGFNLVKSRIYGREVSIRPNFFSQRLSHARQGTFFQVSVPGFAIQGIDLYKALTEEKVDLKKIILEGARLRVFRNGSAEADSVRIHKGKNRKRRPLNKADFYSIIAGKLRSVKVDSLIVHNFSLEYFSSIYDRNPELRVGRMDIGVEDFRLDSLSHKRKNRIFYSKNIDLNLYEIDLALRDGIHMLDAGNVYISTKKRILEIEGGLLYPNKKKNLLDSGRMRNTLYVLLPSLKFNNLDILKAFYRQELVFSELLIENPDVHFTKYKPAVKKARRFAKPQDFFEESNEDAVYELLKKYLKLIRGDSIIIDKGYMAFHQYADSSDRRIASGNFGLKMFDFLIDSVHGMNQQGYFYSRDFDFDVHSFVFTSPDSLRQLSVNNLHVATTDSIIHADGIRFDHLHDSLQETNRKSNVAFTFTLDSLFLQGLNHKKLFLEKRVEANELVLENPELSLKSWDPLNTGDLERQRKKAGQDVVKYLNIKKLYILKGDISFDGLERSKSSYFKLHDIDFSVQDLDMKLPDRGKRNGYIRFDSIGLSVRPLRMIVMDSAYEFRCDDIRIKNYPIDITALKISISPLLHSRLLREGRPLLLTSVPYLKIEDFYFDRAIFEGVWMVGGITVPRLEATIGLPQKKKSNTAKAPMKLNFSLPKGSIRVDSLNIGNARVDLMTQKPEGPEEFLIENLNLRIRGFLIDSLHREGIPGVPLFNADDISVSAKGRHFITKDSLYDIGFKNITASTSRKYLRLDSISLHPRYPKEEFYRRLGYQTDIFNIDMPAAELFSLDFGKLLSGPFLKASLLRLSDIKMMVYRDKRIKTLKPGKKYLLQSVIKNLKLPLNLDSVRVLNANVRYEEQTGDEPGHIFFDRMNITALNVSNDSATLKKNKYMKADGTAYFMGKGLMKGKFTFDMMHPRDSLWWSGNVDTVDLRDINPMLTRLLPAKISHGTVSKVMVPLVAANDHTAVGQITLHYRNLYIELKLVNKGSLRKVANELITDVANAIIPDENPDVYGKTRRGVIWFRRDTTKAIFNYLWKSTLSGIKSSVGVNSAEQKQIKKDLKKKRR